MDFFFFFPDQKTNNLEVCRPLGGQSRQTHFRIRPSSGRSDPQTDAGYCLTLGSRGPFSSQLSEQNVWHVSQWEEGFQAACAGRGRLLDPKPAAAPRRKQDAGDPSGAFGSPYRVKSRSEPHRHAYFSARALAHACGNLQADPEKNAS